MTNEVPFPGMPLKRLREIVSEENFRPEIPSGIESSLSDLMISCWNIDPADRPQMDLIFNVLCDLETSTLGK